MLHALLQYTGHFGAISVSIDFMSVKWLYCLVTIVTYVNNSQYLSHLHEKRKRMKFVFAFSQFEKFRSEQEAY